MNWHLSRLGLAVLFCVAVFCFALVGLLLVLVFGFLFGLFGGDFVTAYWTALRSFTSSLLRPLNQQTAMCMR
jgi:hypothetical protein